MLMKELEYKTEHKISTNNFSYALSEELAERAIKYFRADYDLSFLFAEQKFLFTEIKHNMLEKVKKIITELGDDFCFIGNQHKLIIQQEEFFVDLLFYHRSLQCLVAVVY